MRKWWALTAALLILGTGLLAWRWLQPAALNDSPQLIVDKSLNRLYLFADGRLQRRYPVSTGREADLTPEGCFTIVSRHRLGANSNPALGSHWLGLSAPPSPRGGHYGIHGTDEPQLIGRHVSAGCIRLRPDDIIHLYDRVELGTLVCIRRGPMWLWQLGDWLQERGVLTWTHQWMWRVM